MLYAVKSYRNHPAIRMWKSYEPALNIYGRAICLEWRGRGHDDTQLDRLFDPPTWDLPPWFGDEAFHLSHRSNLCRKDPRYRELWPDVPLDLPYYWPVL